jgi:toxin YoeB
MGKYHIVFDALAQKHISKHYKSGNKVIIKRIEQILIELSETPYEGIGNPEALKYSLSSIWSRRISQKDRLIYKVEENVITVFVISALGHYGDK